MCHPLSPIIPLSSLSWPLSQICLHAFYSLTFVSIHPSIPGEDTWALIPCAGATPAPGNLAAGSSQLPLLAGNSHRPPRHALPWDTSLSGTGWLTTSERQRPGSMTQRLAFLLQLRTTSKDHPSPGSPSESDEAPFATWFQVSISHYYLCLLLPSEACFWSMT